MYLIMGAGEPDDREVWWPRAHLSILRQQLGDLKHHLLEWKKAHGRYPTNDDGLAVLDSFAARFSVTYNPCPDEAPGGERGFYGNDHMGFFWNQAQREIRRYREVHGHVPRNAREFCETHLGQALDIGPAFADDLGWTHVRPYIEVEFAIGKSDTLFIIGPTGAMTGWLVPFVYENRTGLDPALFADSPANGRKSDRYSARVDDGIYVYALGGQLYSRDYDARWWEYHGPRMAGGGLLLLSLGALVVLWRSSRKAAIAGAVIALGAGGLGTLAGSTYATWYVMVPLFGRRDAQMVAQQKELLDKYRSRGIIGDATHQKALAALDKPLTVRPATAPADPK
jgi:hypothetical protein